MPRGMRVAQGARMQTVPSMSGSGPATQHRFGGAWTADKLQVLRDYLGFYTQALRSQRFRLIYIDSFAGTGRCRIRVGAHHETVIDGSAKIALDCSPAFDAYHFIERKKSHAAELAQLIASHPNGARATLGTRGARSPLTNRSPMKSPRPANQTGAFCGGQRTGRLCVPMLVFVDVSGPSRLHLSRERGER
jgi:hypothetical protein